MGIPKVLATFLCVTAISSVVLGIDENSAKEQPCFKVAHAIDPDENWVSSVKTWYYALASRLDLYRSAHDLLETDFKNIIESGVYYDSCIQSTINPEGLTFSGYNGRKRLLRTTQVAPGTVDYKSEWSKGMVGRAYTTLTDNKTFVFYAACFADDQMTWNVFQTVKSLDDATREKILQHAISLGYNPEFFTEIRPALCENDGKLSKQGDALSLSSSSNSKVNETESITFEQDSFICSACKRVCPELVSKNHNLTWYKKRLQKYKEMCSAKNKH